MVVLAASIITKTGKALVSRQFVDMGKIWIEGLLAAFPQLVESGKQHTYVETENVRCVYQPIESVNLLVITNKQSNILEDLDTLRLLSKMVLQYATSLDEEGICEMAFEIIFAFDEAISVGYNENVTVAQVKQNCEMESHEERLHKLIMQSKINETKDVMKRKASEIDKINIEKNRSEREGLKSLQSSGGSIRLDVGFVDMIISSGCSFGSNSGFGPSFDSDSFSSKSKGHASAPATAPPKSMGMQLGKSQKTNQFLESLKAEGEVIVEDVQPIVGRSKASVPVDTDHIIINIKEKLNVVLKRDGGLNSFEVRGTLDLQALKKEDRFIQMQIETGANEGFQFKTNPHINKDLFLRENLLAVRDPSKPFPASRMGDPLGDDSVRWRMQSALEDVVPLNINCWSSVSGGETYFNIEYEASPAFDLQNVLISIPLPALRDHPTINQFDGDWRYDSRKSVLEWSIFLIDSTNRSGSMEFLVPVEDPSSFFPIDVRFTAAKTFCDIKVANVIPVNGGSPLKFASRMQLVTENYQVV